MVFWKTVLAEQIYAKTNYKKHLSIDFSENFDLHEKMYFTADKLLKESIFC